MTSAQLAKDAADAVRAHLPESPRAAIVLGSGLADFGDSLDRSIIIPYDTIPHYPEPTVPGHVGQLVFGYAGKLPVLAAKGRFHYYEGHDLDTVSLPIRLFAALGVKTVIITNAAGCVRPEWSEGDLMLITGHMDYTSRNGPHDPVPSTGEPWYSTPFLELARQAAQDTGTTLREGVYTWCLGPMFETPAEIRDIRRLGGDAVGMSTLPEIVAAEEEDLNMVGISCLTNMAAGITGQPLDHEEVLETGQRVKATFRQLVTTILQRLDEQES